MCVSGCSWSTLLRAAAVVVLLALQACCVSSLSDQCLPITLANNCPNPTDYAMYVDGTTANTTVVGGFFSVSMWDRISEETDSEVCTLCDASSAQFPPHRFAVEQAEALLYATDLINAMDRNRMLSYRLYDTCGNDETRDNCARSQMTWLAREKLPRVLASIVCPFYQIHSVSMPESEFVELANNVVNEEEDHSTDLLIQTGFLSLLDSPFLHSSTVKFDVFLPYQNQFLMLQQTCELQALVAVDFLAQEGWGDVTLVTSGDYCGGESTLLFKQQIDDKDLDCHFNVGG